MEERIDWWLRRSLSDRQALVLLLRVNRKGISVLVRDEKVIGLSGTLKDLLAVFDDFGAEKAARHLLEGRRP